MAQADSLKPFDFNRNTKAFISRLVLVLGKLEAYPSLHSVCGHAVQRQNPLRD
jgi:hypothetical protein